MKVLVTGAGGFLGRRVVSALLERGHEVRALVRRPNGEVHASGAEVLVGDLRAAGRIPGLLDDVDTVVHLAAVVVGGPDAQFSGTVGATENLLAAMSDSSVTRLVLASSLSVYDWSEVSGTLDEDSPLEADLGTRDGYAVAKVWQERVCRRAAAGAGWSLTVLRPGFIWGPGADWVWGVGVRAGSTTVVVDSRRPLPLTFVDNCADAFATVVGDERAAGRTYNVVDGFAVTPRAYARLYNAQHGGRALAVPYRVVRAIGWTAGLVLRVLSGRPARLPAIFDPHLFDARFKPLVFPPSRLTEELEWQPPYGLGASTARTFPAVRAADGARRQSSGHYRYRFAGRRPVVGRGAATARPPAG